MSDSSTTPSHRTPALLLAALGVVYGDVGTSPLYTIKEIFGGSHAVAVTQANVLGALSLIFWGLTLVISIKYVLFVMRADNRGEGGIMALMALALRCRHMRYERAVIIALGLCGTALFYGDGVITPAISVLSAIEGLEIAMPAFEKYVIPASLLVLALLFWMQAHGTEKVGKIFGPVMLVWFATLGWLGYQSALQTPLVWQALNPVHGLHFFQEHGWFGFLALGAVVLCLTGAEALYADMGHFGRLPIRLDWFFLVFPALILNYFGQGALLLRDAAAVQNPFYLLAPDWALYPMVALSTLATVIASQAVISGAFSITRQAIHLDYLPRLRLVHTSSEEVGQIYVPLMNVILLIFVAIVVINFGSSTNLAAAYGIAVTGTMAITTLLALLVALDSWKWPPLLAGTVFGVFLVVDGAFFSANALKIPQGGWLPLVLGAVIYLLMSTWRHGRNVLFQHLLQGSRSLMGFLAEITALQPLRVPGTAIYMTSRQLSLPPHLLRNYEHNRIIHQSVVLLTVEIEDIPRVPQSERIMAEALEEGFYRITIHYGFMQTPDVPKALALCQAQGLELDLSDATFFIGRETLLPSTKKDLNPWQEQIFLFLFRSASDPVAYFRIPPDRVLELGAQYEI
ncbi:MAG: potassium transporter Kup [Methylococcaceae bacterium]|nr:MAG: potassium transporter Kup [Methylococcaceae bacterium]